ncbi:HAD family hydrolase [Swaminathania salitolerans]|uniref:Hydrolase n=1 Tax=Swaminathania salitolerans TaxID=182838 RepID=A0A511BQZ8_9PROT|nr:HAD family phosphatase [Swaminathania salitolerans]GBQ12189.1 phosphatase [Swaminathania salitolerans LMG 21291]GEL02761.1 hydrolase [Swaminathania salitolerans]
MNDTASHALSPRGRLALVIFDCDGVLIDSEGPTCRLIASFARERGIALSDDAAEARFAGMALGAVKAELEAESGRALGDSFVQDMQDRFVSLMAREAVAIPGARDALAGVAALGLGIRVGSNSSWPEMEAKFARTGLMSFLDRSRIHSARDMMRPKPDPFVFLHAAGEEGVSPERCVVIEDSDTGVRAAHDAGMACILLRDSDTMPPVSWPGLRRIRHLDALGPLLAGIRESQTR